MIAYDVGEVLLLLLHETAASSVAMCSRANDVLVLRYHIDSREIVLGRIRSN